MKKTSKITTWLLACSFIGAISITGCKKEESLTPINTAAEPDAVEVAATQQATAEEAATEAQFDDVFNITASMNKSEAGEDLGVSANVSGLSEPGSTSTTAARCFTVTVVPNIPNVFPKTVTIDFGNGCLGQDGKYRKGKIVSIYTSPMSVPGAKVSTTFLGYQVDSLKIEGTHISENTSTSNMQGWKALVIDGKVTNVNTNRWIKWNSTKNVLQVAGNGTPNLPMDDVYKITGFARSLNSGGGTWTALVTDPLIKKFSCRWIVQGTVKITKNSQVAILDYGDGRCDNLAVIIINGIRHIITL